MSPRSGYARCPLLKNLRAKGTLAILCDEKVNRSLPTSLGLGCLAILCDEKGGRAASDISSLGLGCLAILCDEKADRSLRSFLL